VAVRYGKGMSSPVVVAKGQDFLALRIREVAKQHDIILVENKALARTLYKTVKVGQEIPPSLYSSVIEVMKYIYQIKGKDYFNRSDTVRT
jgi:flagellar biosynthesis protein FlhB